MAAALADPRTGTMAAARGRRLVELYSGHARTRKSFGLMTRKLSVTELQDFGHHLGLFLRRKSSATSANSRYVA